ncbi:MAG: hypothetical protein KAG37_01620 [Flavobacteriales bacterium]|nr:hypothetical protein [Flavobacteriales bacterium]
MKKLISSLIIITAIFSCSKGLDSVECESKNTDEGIIVSSVDFGSCIYNLDNKTFIIQDTTEYKELQKEINDGRIGDDSCSFPTIGFTDSLKPLTLLGQYAQGTGCTINFNRNVKVDSTNNKVDYIINPEGCGDCEMLGYSYNFVLVEKIDSTYTILFNGETK